MALWGLKHATFQSLLPFNLEQVALFPLLPPFYPFLIYLEQRPPFSLGDLQTSPCPEVSDWWCPPNSPEILAHLAPIG